MQNHSPSGSSPAESTKRVAASGIMPPFGSNATSEMGALSAGVGSFGISSSAQYEAPPLPDQPSHPVIPTVIPSSDWSFKKKILVARSLDSKPTKAKAPSQDYLRLAATESSKLNEKDMIGQRPKLLVLDLNQTLLVRKRSTGKASKNATPRPYLSAFWEYICGSEKVQPGVFQRRFNVMVRSIQLTCQGQTYLTIRSCTGLVIR